MLKRKLYSRVNWRKYLDPTNRPRVNSFIKQRGDVVFGQIVETIKEAIKEETPEIMIMVHPNVSSVVVINSDEYKEVLTHCLNYFKSKEQ